jgi:hypothetical protein
MNEAEAHDLLIRIDTRLSGINMRLERMEIAQERRPCNVHAEKIKTLEKIVWGSLMLSLAAMVKSFWHAVGGGN